MTALTAAAAELFNHVTADKAAIYRAVMDVFSAAKRQFRLHLRPDEVLAEVRWPGDRPTLDDVQAVLAQLAAWGNLQAQPDTARVASIEDFYRKRLLYRITAGGEAVEASLAVFVQTLARGGELESVAVDDRVRSFKAVVDGEYDHLPEAAFYNVGTIEDAVAKAEQLAGGG